MTDALVLANDLLGATGGDVLAAYADSPERRIAGASPTVAIIGAGLAGLCAARVLSLGGCSVTLYEAGSRIGGRVWTDHGSLEPGLISELGGEFIDSDHWDMLALAANFALPLIDTGAPSERDLSTAYCFDGRLRSEDEVQAAFSEVVPFLSRDIARLSPVVSRARHTETDRRFDRMSIAEYLDSLPMESWLRQLIAVAYTTEYGLDIEEQSSINLLSLIGVDATEGFSPFGASDERYKIRDGADAIIHRLAQPMQDRLRLEHRLLRLHGRGSSYRLSLQTPGGVVETSADVVLLALPFTMLRQVDLGDTLPAWKLRSIRELGYGMNSKVLVGLHHRIWRQQGFEGGVYTDLDLQTGWDSSRLRGGENGVFTYFLGGRLSVEAGQGGADAHANRLAALTERIYSGFQALRTGSVLRVHWPSEPLALGSYTCYRCGQWTMIGGDEFTPVGAIYFAGEHCDTDAQGYMNGAASTGRQAAQAILARLR